jgi:hypothetical protein
MPSIPPPDARTSRRRFCAALLAWPIALVLPSCELDGNFTLFGYTTQPNYDTNIKTVRVPIFQNATFYRGLEFDVTRAVVREIQLKTPYRVVSGNQPADTELTGKIVSFTKGILNRNQLNEVREAETNLGVEVVWKDLRTGEYLSNPRRGPAPEPPPPALGLPPPPPPKPSPVMVFSLGHFIPEVGQSMATAQQENVNRLAIQIVSMMEKPW